MSDTPYVPWMKSLLNRMKELYGKTGAKTIAEALPDGNFFKIKGSVATSASLPATGNSIGDIYIVSEDGSEYIWVTNETYPNGYWEKLGGEGSSVTAAAVASAIGDMSSVQAAQALEDLGGAPADEAHLVTPSIVDSLSQPTAAIYLDAYADPNAPSDPVVLQVVSEGNYPVNISGVADPTLDGHAANKRYVDGYVETISGATPSITPAANTIYKCGTLTSLTISTPPATGAYSIVFTSGSTATTTTIPSTILGLEDFAAEANTLYEINVLDNRAIVGSWAVST